MNPTKNTADKIFLMRRIIGLELRLLRTEKKLTLSEAAHQSGVSIKNIKLIESGKSFSREKINPFGSRPPKRRINKKY